MSADVAQEVDVIEFIEPVGIVRHYRVVCRGPVAKAQEARKDRANGFEIFINGFVGKKPPAFILARWIADARSAAAHQGDRPVAGLLQPIEQHDR